MKSIGIFAALWILLLLCCGAAAEELRYEMKTTDNGSGSFVSRPEFSGACADQINEAVRSGARIDEYLALLENVGAGGVGLQVRSEVWPQDGESPAVSVLVSAKGRMLEGRPSQIRYSFVFDTATGELLSASDLFSDPGEAEAWLNEYLEREVEENLSSYLENRALIPVSLDRFALCARGVTFLYDYDSLSFLSGDAGAVTVPYFELRPLLSREGPLAFLAQEEDPDTCRESLVSEAAEGKLPGLPAYVGENWEEARELFHTPFDSEVCPGGLLWETEDSRLRDCLLVTDRAEEEVTGILCTRLSLCGMESGKAERAAWLTLFGAPEKSLEMTPERAAAWRLAPGTCDIYRFGEMLLILHADGEGIFDACLLMKAAVWEENE